MKLKGAIAFLLVLGFGVPAWAQSDFQWTFDNAGFLSYNISSVSSTRVFSGALGTANPTIDLIVGSRYQVTVVNSGTHPFQVLAKGADPGTDVVLLSTGATAGTLEADPDINWQDSGAATNGAVTFTVTQALVDAMRASAHIPGYRCEVHTGIMRGNFNVVGAKLVNPIPAGIPAGSVFVGLQTVADGLIAPVCVVFPDDGSNRMLVADQTGIVWLYVGGIKQATPFLDVTGRLVPVGIPAFGNYDERGLIGLALHPNFATDPRVYTWTSEPVGPVADFTVPITGAFDHQNVLTEWTVSATDPNVIDPTTRKELLREDHPQFNHNGGAVRFGSDGYLYWGDGDGGNGDDQGPGHNTVTGNAQNLQTILGKILRIDVDGGGTASANGQYGIPATNPISGAGMVREIYAFGVRNPFSFSFDRVTGELYLGEVGQNDIEEVDTVISGQNCGWHVKEGSFYFNPNGALDGFVSNDPVYSPLPTGLADPIAEYDHDEGIAVIGGFVYRGTAIPELVGRYVFGDLGRSFSSPSGRLFYLDSGNVIKELQLGAGSPPLGLYVRGFGEGPDGELYLCASTEIAIQGTGGVVQKFVPGAGAPVAPTASFTSDVTSGLAPLTVQFADTSAPGTSPITSWAWTFGDTGVSTAQNPSRVYTTAGTYTVSLSVTTADGSDQVTRTGYVTITAPTGCGITVPEKSGGLRSGDAYLMTAMVVLLAAFGLSQTRRRRA